MRLRGTVAIEHSLARLGAGKLWHYLHEEPFVNALGALTGNQAMQQVKAGLKAIYLSGWQVAADANVAGEMYPDQSLYPANSVPLVVKRINNTLLRADQIHHAEGNDRHRLAAADRGRRRGRIRRRAQRLRADEGDDRGGRRRRALRRPARLGEEVRAHGRQGAGADPGSRAEADRRAPGRRRDGRADPDRRPHRCRGGGPDHLGHRSERPGRSCTGERTVEGFYKTRPGLDQAISRGLAYAPYADLVWCETGKPDLEFARKFAEAIHAKYPGKLLAYNCSPSFNWKKNLDDATIANFQHELAADGLQVPVHHPGRLPRAELLDVRTSPTVTRAAR